MSVGVVPMYLGILGATWACRVFMAFKAVVSMLDLGLVPSFPVGFKTTSLWGRTNPVGRLVVLLNGLLDNGFTLGRGLVDMGLFCWS
jgi:hypothetical protein